MLQKNIFLYIFPLFTWLFISPLLETGEGVPSLCLGGALSCALSIGEAGDGTETPSVVPLLSATTVSPDLSTVVGVLTTTGCTDFRRTCWGLGLATTAGTVGVLTGFGTEEGGRLIKRGLSRTLMPS